MKNSPLREVRCIVCGSSFLSIHGAQLCSERCRAKRKRDRYRQNKPTKAPRPTSTTGIINEYRVILDLLQKGYEVFHAVSPATSCDLVTLKDGHLLRVEVKTGQPSPTGMLHKIPIRVAEGKADVLATVMPYEIIYDPSSLITSPAK